VATVDIIQKTCLLKKIVGYPDGLFDPQAAATKAEVVTVFARFLALIEE